MIRALAWTLALAGALFLAGCGSAPAEAPDAPRRVVLVLLENVRADRVGHLGDPRGLTPHLDRLAQGGVTFTRARAASSYGPQALASLWTGLLPSESGSIGLGAAPPEDKETLPRAFRRAGFRTALVANGQGLRARAFTRHFDELEVDSEPGRWRANEVTAKALDLVASAEEESLFLVVDYADALEPHLPAAEDRARVDVPESQALLSLPELRAALGRLPEGFERSPGFLDLVARYEAEVALVDDSLGALVAGLEEHGGLAHTLLVVVGTHGTELLEHGGVGSGWTLHEEVLAVPLVAHWPAHLAARREEEPMSVLALVQDLIASTRAPEDPQLLRRSLAVAPVLAEVILPELVVARAAAARDGLLIETIQWTAPEEREARLAGLGQRFAALERGEAAPVDLFATPLRRDTFVRALDGRLRPGEPATSLAEALTRFVAKCRTEFVPVERSVPRPQSTEDGASDLGELQGIGYL